MAINLPQKQDWAGPDADTYEDTIAADKAFGAGSGSIYDPWLQKSYLTPGYGKGAHGSVVRLAGTPLAGGERDAYSPAGGTLADTAFGKTAAAGGFTAADLAAHGVADRAPATGYGGIGGGGGGMAGAYSGGYSLPDAAGASQALRDLQMGGARGLQGLLSRDTTAQRKAMEDALYAGQAEGINSAADRARMQMLEGTFGRGVGSSSILVELAGRGEQEHADALARARREAFTQAGAEDRADLASALGLNQGAFSAGTTGLQGEANVALANLAREQAASQFSQNLGFQGSENALNRAQQASQFQGNLGLSYAQLGQQASQFGQNLGFQGSENALNRAQQQALASQGYDFQGGQAQLNRDQQEALARMGYDFSGGQAQLNREFQGSQAQLSREQQQALANQGYDFSGGQAALNREQQQALASQGYDFTGDQAALQRDLQKYLAESSQGFTGDQNAAARKQAMDMLLLQLSNSQDIAGQNRIGAGIGAGITGVGSLLGPWLAQYLKSLGD